MSSILKEKKARKIFHQLLQHCAFWSKLLIYLLYHQKSIYLSHELEWKLPTLFYLTLPTFKKTTKYGI